jgi:hypothetical protein
VAIFRGDEFLQPHPKKAGEGVQGRFRSDL